MPEATGLGATPSEESEESSHLQRAMVATGRVPPLMDSVAARVGRWA